MSTLKCTNCADLKMCGPSNKEYCFTHNKCYFKLNKLTNCHSCQHHHSKTAQSIECPQCTFYSNFELKENETMEDQREYTIDDLHTGMRVELESKERFIVQNIPGCQRIITNTKSTRSLEYYNEDLTDTNYSRYNINTIYAFPKEHTHYALDPNFVGPKLWERKTPIKDMTIAEIEKELGYPIRVIKEEK